ncbi:MAG: hypothetical protein Q7R78_01355 [bacterium]|nr:hypothetical protein [bacterium]
MFKKNIVINIGFLAMIIVALLLFVYYNFKSTGLSSSNSNTQVSFEKKQDCAVYKKQIEDKFNKNNNSELVVEYYYLDKIFYSPMENSCLFIYSGQFGIKASERYRTVYLEDALSGDILTKATVIEQGKYMGENQAVFDIRVKEYENK